MKPLTGVMVRGGVRERSERGFLRRRRDFLVKTHDFFMDFVDGRFRLLCLLLFAHNSREASHEWDTQEMMQHQHVMEFSKLIHVDKVRLTRSLTIVQTECAIVIASS